MKRNPDPLNAARPASQWRRLPPFASLLIATILIACFPPAARGADLTKLLSGKEFPLSLKLKDLNGEWRRFTLHSPANVSGNISVTVNGNGSINSPQNNIASTGERRFYFTQGRTVVANDQVYLVAYHLPVGALDLYALIQSLAAKTPVEAAALTPESILPLSLLDVRSIGSLEDVRAFDLKVELAESEKAAQAIAALIKAASGGDSKPPAATPKSSAEIQAPVSK